MSELSEHLRAIADGYRPVDEAMADKFTILQYAVERAQDARDNQLAREFGRRDMELEARLRGIERNHRSHAEILDKICRLMAEHGMFDDPEQADAAGV